MLAEKCGKQLPKAMGYLGLAWGLVILSPQTHILLMCRQRTCMIVPKLALQHCPPSCACRQCTSSERRWSGAGKYAWPNDWRGICQPLHCFWSFIPCMRRGTDFPHQVSVLGLCMPDQTSCVTALVGTLIVLRHTHTP